MWGGVPGEVCGEVWGSLGQLEGLREGVGVPGGGRRGLVVPGSDRGSLGVPEMQWEVWGSLGRRRGRFGGLGERRERFGGPWGGAWGALGIPGATRGAQGSVWVSPGVVYGGPCGVRRVPAPP